jgi:hypothetical protein
MILRKEQQEDQRNTETRLQKAEQVARDHARRLRRLEVEVGIIYPTDRRKRPT